MKSIFNLFRSLPLEVQNLIGEFNVWHREQMREIHQEFLGIIYNPCRTCKLPYPQEIFYSVDYFIAHKYKMRCFWCCDYCFDVETNEYMKNKYMVSIKDYLLNHSITHRGEE